MNKIAQFEKVSLNQFINDWIDTFGNRPNHIITEIYNNLKLPKRATSGSAGYDFFMPYGFLLKPNESITIPTGIRCKMEEGWVLKMYPRSGHGFKTGVHLSNTVGIIDADYYKAKNEGHIFIKLVNDSNIAKEINLQDGLGFCQGIFIQFGITVDDEAEGERHGGFGSTNK